MYYQNQNILKLKVKYIRNNKISDQTYVD